MNIKDPEADRLARELARATGVTLTEAVMVALKERLQRVQARHPGRALADELDEIALHCAGLPDLDQRTADEIIDYDEHGLPR